MKRFLTLALVAGCSSSNGSSDVVGPFTGTPHRYVVDRITLLQSDVQTELGDDLDGNGTIDNQLGTIISALAMTHDTSTHAADMIAAGSLASSVEVDANSLGNDDLVGVRFFGADTDAATAVGGRIHAGTFVSNRTRETQAPGAATVRLPIFADADPLPLSLEGVEIDFGSDGTGGLDAIIRGGIPVADAQAMAYAGIAQMMKTNPAAHLPFARILDADHDGTITTTELQDNTLVTAFIRTDLHATMRVSVGFFVHLSPCASGRCTTTPPADACHDRLRDGNETDVDCGGSCLPCAAGVTCNVPADCQTGGCDSGHCRVPTCTDGLRDGFESDVDCGDVGCAPCAIGKVCAAGNDCTSKNCMQGIGTTGVCGS
ncbi:MAG: hypothetical protein JWO36_3905 [Myxococcales bacterium]|nr:hypothetical protein [Myxococcales bacterium]